MNGLGVEYLKLGEEIARTCYKMYRQSPMGLSPEVVAINDAADPHKAMEVSVSAGCLALCLSCMQRPVHPPFGWVKLCCGRVEISVDW